jgi:hypothetical protein
MSSIQGVDLLVPLSTMAFKMNRQIKLKDVQEINRLSSTCLYFGTESLTTRLGYLLIGGTIRASTIIHIIKMNCTVDLYN